MAGEHPRCAARAALLEEERDVGDDRAAEGEQDSELDDQFSMKRMRARFRATPAFPIDGLGPALDMSLAGPTIV
jgi:hypothetical protein